MVIDKKIELCYTAKGDLLIPNFGGQSKVMKFAQLFCDGLIVQANKPFRVFGEGEGHGSVTWQGVTKEICGKDGKWLAEFDPMPYGGPYTLDAELDGEKYTINDIYVGEVILFSGQSNIQFRMNAEATPPALYQADDMLRIFVCERMEAGELILPSDGWVKAHPDNIGGWSALAHLVGKELRKCGCPAVGVVACAQGASVIQSWLPRDVFVGSELELPFEVLFSDHHNKVFQLWNRYGTLYDFMLSRLIPYSFGAVVWYQGESNSSVAEGEIYDKLLSCLITTWRQRFIASELPFIVVQIADYFEEKDRIKAWKLVQQKQDLISNPVSGVVTVRSGDICETNDIHPRTKSRLAKRIVDTMRENEILSFFKN